MARIDITELLTDPDFVDNVALVNRSPSVNALGENVLRIDSEVPTIGSVQPANYITIMRLPDEFRVAGVFSFWIKAEIIASAPNKYSSLLVFKNTTYQVQTVADWTNWGSGWTEGTCVRQNPS